MPGYCGGISLGNWFGLDELLLAGIDPKEQPVLALLVAEDMAGLLRFAQAEGYAELEGGVRFQVRFVPGPAGIPGAARRVPRIGPTGVL